MARLAVLCLLAVVCCAAVGAAADPKLMVSDVLVSSKSTKARTSSYYDDTELACMAQLNFKNCRYTGCPVDTNFQTCADTESVEDCRQCAPDSIYFQTDFSCCPKQHSYYGEGDHGDHIGLAFNDKVGTCDWEISMYRVGALSGVNTTAGDEDDMTGAETDPWNPHFTDDGTALKWGTAWGTCYLNGEAEHCDHPLCERMAINIQGGLYATCAYSTDSTITAAPSQGTCSDGNTEGPFTWNDFTFAGVLTGLQEASYNRLAPTCFGVSGSTAGRRLLSDNSAQDYEGQTYYPGVALVLSGPMTVTAKKDHRFEETGMFQQTISFKGQNGDTTGTTDITNRWPIVAPRGTKARFTRRSEGYYKGGSQYV